MAEALHEAGREATTLVIAHRLSTVRLGWQGGTLEAMPHFVGLCASSRKALHQNLMPLPSAPTALAPHLLTLIRCSILAAGGV